MPVPRTLRCPRFLLVVAIMLAFLVNAFALAVDHAVGGQPPDRSWSRLYYVLLMLVALLAVIAVCAATLRSRVIMKDGGVELVWPFRRYGFTWDEISEITIDTGFRYWQVHVRSAEREHLAFVYPVWPMGAAAEADSQRHHFPPPHTPRGLTMLVAELQETWVQRRDQSFSTGA